MREATLTLKLNGRGDLIVEIPPHVMAAMGFPHSVKWVEKGDQLVAIPSMSKWSQRQIKKFKTRHGLT